MQTGCGSGLPSPIMPLRACLHGSQPRASRSSATARRLPGAVLSLIGRTRLIPCRDRQVAQHPRGQGGPAWGARSMATYTPSLPWATTLDHGVALHLACEGANGGAEQGGEHLWPGVARQVCSAARAAGAVPAWLAPPAAAAEPVRGPVTVRAVPGRCGQAITSRLSLRPL
jgi:hypothetical protein